MNAMKYVLFFLFLIIPLGASAQSVVSFSATPANINSGYFVDFVWRLSNTGGYSFLIPCQTGVILKNSDGTTFPCGTKKKSTTRTDDYISVAVFNISGSAKNVTGKIIPLDGTGQEVESAAVLASVSVTADPKPIKTFTSSTPSVATGQQVILSWTSIALGGVNLTFECKEAIRVSSPSYSSAFMPCGAPVFTPDLAPNGSLTVNFSNSSASSLSYKILLLPAISPGSYDGMHAENILLDIASDILPDPYIAYFNASSTAVASGQELKIAWDTQNTKTTNLTLSCDKNLVASSSPTSSALACDTLLFPNGLTPSGNISLWFTNTGPGPESVQLTLLPGKKIGEYDATRSKNITITVRQAGAVPPSPPPNPPINQPPPPAPPPPTPKTIFTQTLKRGTQNPQVKALQQYLKRDPLLYPEGLITGYFGPATERAVQRFQKKYNIISTGSPATGFGVVGPKTRNQLNLLQ